MIIELGHYALILALLLAFVQAVVPMAGAQYGRRVWLELGQQAGLAVWMLLSIAFFSLMHAFALSDFSVVNVVQNSHTMKPLLYKITAVWGSHEGSMLLWVWMLAFWGAAVARAGRGLPADFQARALSVQGMVQAGFLLFVVFASNPFARIDPPAPEGMDLNPVLQDIALAVHPPLLYLGYVGFSVTFSFAIAALIGGKIDSAWASFLRPWVLAAWVFLTAGIGIGAVWAYYELGWGGFWFWDPVENAALMPWLAGTALLHSIAVLEKRGTLKNWTIFLAILTFSLSLLGTFLVRSGVLTSVHAFAADPLRGVFILALLTLAVGGALFLYALRAPRIRHGAPLPPASRETALMVNNVFLFAMTATVFMGTLYPVFLSALGAGDVSVGTPFYTATLLPMFLPFAALMGVAPVLVWRGGRMDVAARRLRAPVLMFAAALAVVLWFAAFSRPVMLAGVAGALWIFIATAHDVYRKTSRFSSWRLLSPSYYGMVVAHAGFALLMAGAVVSTQAAQERILWMQPGARVDIGGRTVVYLSHKTDIGKNYNYERLVFALQDAARTDSFVFLEPEKRWYPSVETWTTEAALHYSGLDMYYVVAGDQDGKNPARFVVRMYYHPMIGLLFAGGGMIALGGLISMAQRKRRQA